jgi:integrase/recombinase XerD
MGALRQKMIKTMELRNFAKNTQRGYLGAVKGLACYYHQSPDQLTKDAIEDYLLYLKNGKGNTIGSCGAVAAGLRFFYTHPEGYGYIVRLLVEQKWVEFK